jgi:hypothetical protein
VVSYAITVALTMINVLGREVHSEKEALADLLDALDVAENAARQIALLRDQPRWMIMAGTLGQTRQVCSLMGQRTFG